MRLWLSVDGMFRPGPVLAASALVGCTLGHGARPVAPAPAGPPAVEQDTGVERRTIVIENGFVSFTLEIPREPAGAKPAVIGSIDQRQRVPEAGWVMVQYQVHWETLRGLAPPPPPPPAEAPPAGSQGAPGGQADATATPQRTWGKWLLASPNPETIGKGFFELIDLQSNYVIPRVIDALAHVPEVDASRIAVVGASTSGFVALQAAKDRRIRTVVALVATGDYPCFLEHSALAMNGEPLRLDPSYRRFLLSRDPARHPQRLVHAAVLLVNGREDLAMPFSCVEVTIARLRNAFARAGVPERFRSVVFDEGHNLGPEANIEAMAWLYRWLEPHRGAAARTSAS